MAVVVGGGPGRPGPLAAARRPLARAAPHSLDASLPTLLPRDPNTIFRGNSLTSKCIDETMKLAGMQYLHVTLKPAIEEVRARGGAGRPGARSRRHRRPASRAASERPKSPSLSS